MLDLPDPSSSSSGNISKYFDAVYEQIAFNVTALLYQEQITSGYVDKECDVLSLLREDFANQVLKVSTIAPAMKTLYESIKENNIARITLHDLPLELQLPPFLDSLLQADEDGYCEEDIVDEDSEPNLMPGALLRLNDEDDGQGYQLYMQLRAAQLHPEERELAEQLLKFLELASVNLSLADMASLLDWHLEAQVYPVVRWLVMHRRAKVVDVVHSSLKTVFSVPQKFPSKLFLSFLIPFIALRGLGDTGDTPRLATLSEEFSKWFAVSGVPPLPKLLAMISTATHKTTANHFYVTVVQSKDFIPLYLDVVLWMLKRDLLIRLHLRIRIIATEELKEHVRQAWEQHIAHKRSRSRTHSNSRRCGSEGRRKGRRGGGNSDEKAASDSSPVEYWVSLSPKTARKRARQPADGHDKQEEEERDKVEDRDEGDDEDDDKDEGHHDREKRNEEDVDEEFLSSSMDEAKWAEYYKDGVENDNIPSMIGDSARATPLERRWLAGMSEGKEPHIVRRFER
ncbi:hypothetical protein GSI_02127 [Ganoderma sinense ZZ0214-1]|uniref:Nitrogen permease regulator 3 n=1 Tax=Ganoderma sinense ZZ0214-1 TaxID=1077348 RepID=A0A2G8SNR3_9APHY|nr:hypothetical protein GSI_02127 [Ganoderma sinense ZZ0214-1]